MGCDSAARSVTARRRVGAGGARGHRPLQRQGHRRCRPCRGRLPGPGQPPEGLITCDATLPGVTPEPPQLPGFRQLAPLRRGRPRRVTGRGSSTPTAGSPSRSSTSASPSARGRAVPDGGTRDREARPPRDPLRARRRRAARRAALPRHRAVRGVAGRPDRGARPAGPARGHRGRAGRRARAAARPRRARAARRPHAGGRAVPRRRGAGAGRLRAGRAVRLPRRRRAHPDARGPGDRARGRGRGRADGRLRSRLDPLHRARRPVAVPDPARRAGARPARAHPARRAAGGRPGRRGSRTWCWRCSPRNRRRGRRSPGRGRLAADGRPDRRATGTSRSASEGDSRSTRRARRSPVRREPARPGRHPSPWALTAACLAVLVAVVAGVLLVWPAAG